MIYVPNRIFIFTHGSGQIVNLMKDYWHSSVCAWWSFNLQNPNWFDVEMPCHWPQESIPVRCVPSAGKPYELQWPPPDVTPEGRGRELKWTILNRFPVLQCWPPDIAVKGSTNQQDCTNLQWWPQDVTTKEGSQV